MLWDEKVLDIEIKTSTSQDVEILRKPALAPPPTHSKTEKPPLDEYAASELV